ncbi:MAG: hypothetical protein P8124_11610, partial [Gammaproteobacteria bacterium]
MNEHRSVIRNAAWAGETHFEMGSSRRQAGWGYLTERNPTGRSFAAMHAAFIGRACASSTPGAART